MDIKKIPDDISLLLSMKEKGLVSGIPNWVYDDSFIIDFARRKNAFTRYAFCPYALL